MTLERLSMLPPPLCRLPPPLPVAAAAAVLAIMFHVCVDYTSGPLCLRRLHVQASTAARALATTRLCASPASHTCTA